MLELKTFYRCGCSNWKPKKKMYWNFRVKSAANDTLDSEDDNRVQRETVTCSEKPQAMDLKNEVRRLKEAVSILPPVVYVMKMPPQNKFIMGLCIAAMVLFIGVRNHMANKAAKRRQPGSVADLVRRGQLRSDRRGISTPLKYEDPFDNPLVKISKNNSTVEMCGKVYKLAPVMLTKEQQAVHQKRRSRAYQWKRPSIFLKEGDPIPPDVDPDTIRWIPANHPFATTNSEIDEDLAQTNVYQKHGVPFRIQAEHEALQKRLESLQNAQKFSKLVLDPSSARDFERPFKLNMKSEEQIEQSSTASNNQVGPKPSNLEKNSGSFRSNPESEEMPKS